MKDWNRPKGKRKNKVNSWVSQKFCNILVVYHMTKAVQAVKGARCGWLLLWQQVPRQFVFCFTPCVIRKLHRWSGNVGNLCLTSSNCVTTPIKQLKNFNVKKEGAVGHSTVNKWFHLGCKNLDNQARQVGLKLDFVINPASSSRRVSGELTISNSIVVHPIHNVGKSTQSCWIVPHVTKILQNFWLTLVKERKVKTDIKTVWGIFLKKPSNLAAPSLTKKICSVHILKAISFWGALLNIEFVSSWGDVLTPWHLTPCICRLSYLVLSHFF